MGLRNGVLEEAVWMRSANDGVAEMGYRKGGRLSSFYLIWRQVLAGARKC